ncbi:MAG TPA: hypothetical protein VGH77_15515 [Streptosporangiaceae bacterium]
MTGPWWAGLPAAEARLDCGGQPHRLRWADGQLRALDHTDLEGEQILSALAGQGFPCLDVLTVWAEYAADLRVLILASRGLADPLATSTPPSSGPGWVGRAPGRVRSGGSYAVLSYGPPDDPDDDLTELTGLGGLLPDRLVATVIAALAGRLRGAPGPGEAAGADPALATAADAAATAADAAALAAARPALHAALYGRVTVALRSWTGQRDLPVALTMIPEDQPPRLARDGDGIAAQLPFGWLSDVWARGLTTCWGRFCLVAEPAGEGWVLSTVGLDLGPPRRVTLGNPPAS